MAVVSVAAIAFTIFPQTNSWATSVHPRLQLPQILLRQPYLTHMLLTLLGKHLLVGAGGSLLSSARLLLRSLARVKKRRDGLVDKV